jgi:hypothetical protein
LPVRGTFEPAQGTYRATRAAYLDCAKKVDDKFDAKVKVLGEYIEHRVKEERNEMFPKARAARGLDLVALRDQLAARQEELMAAVAPEPAAA